MQFKLSIELRRQIQEFQSNPTIAEWQLAEGRNYYSFPHFRISAFPLPACDFSPAVSSVGFDDCNTPAANKTKPPIESISIVLQSNRIPSNPPDKNPSNFLRNPQQSTKNHRKSNGNLLKSSKIHQKSTKWPNFDYWNDPPHQVSRDSGY